MGETLGKYRIDGLIAEGGMARIYRAKTEGVGGVEKVVALKCLKGSLSEDDNFVQMLLDEARITVGMSHKNIAQVYGLEHDEDRYYMVMELVDGVNLAELSSYLFSQNRVFPIEAAVFVTMEVCSGLSYAHRMTDERGMPLGIVHRDVNPQNICISKEGEVKLIDFGIAKARKASTETQAGTIKGKFNYMSPEQARGERVDQRADVFSLGAVLYEMLCGHMLYPLTLDDMRLRQKTRMADFVPIENYLPDIPDKLRRILAKALTRDINQRFATSRDFLMALTQFFHDGCKVYDSLNLSMLVEKFLSQKGMRSSAPQLPRSPFSRKPVIAGMNDEFAVESGDTAVLSADEARKMAMARQDEEDDSTATAVYVQPTFDKNTGLVTDDLSLARSVDLNIVDAREERTVMVKMNQVDNTMPPVKRFINLVTGKIQGMSERTLAIIAIVLTVMLIIAIVLFIQLNNQQNDGESDGSRAEIAEDAEE